GEVELAVRPLAPRLRRIDVPTDSKTRESYAREKRKLIDNIGLTDPHTIPRNLHLFAGKATLSVVAEARRYVGRNNRCKLASLETYEEANAPGVRTVFAFRHRFIDISHFLARTNTLELDVLVSNLKINN